MKNHWKKENPGWRTIAQENIFYAGNFDIESIIDHCFFIDEEGKVFNTYDFYVINFLQEIKVYTLCRKIIKDLILTGNSFLEVIKPGMSQSNFCLGIQQLPSTDMFIIMKENQILEFQQSNVLRIPASNCVHFQINEIETIHSQNVYGMPMLESLVNSKEKRLENYFTIISKIQDSVNKGMSKLLTMQQEMYVKNFAPPLFKLNTISLKKI